MSYSKGWARALSVALALGSSGLAARAGEADDPRSETYFELKVRPVLAGTCVKCHGPSKASGGLRLDSREAALKGGDGGPAVIPGDPTNSLLVLAVAHAEDEALKMPPDAPLPAASRKDLFAWIEAGAAWPKATEARPATIEAGAHWAFEPLKRVAPPADPSGWAEGSIDRLVAAGHRAQGVKPVGPADRRTLIRRATFDLLGLPPTPEEVEAFAADDSADAYERLVDRLLASPHYGERWGRYWLDLARYADTAGDNSDYPIPEAHLYRDYVIDALNADVPYDRFLHEQIAGDILAADAPSEDYGRLVTATGFVAQAKRFGTRKLEDIHQIIEDSLNTTGQVVLGLSLRCARCHDHKYDPVPARDYYALYGFFAGTKYPFAGAEEDRGPSEFAPLLPPEALKPFEEKKAEAVAAAKAAIDKAEAEGETARRLKELDLAVAEADERLKGAESSSREELEAALNDLKEQQAAAKKKHEAALRPLRRALERAEKGPAEGIPVAYAVREGTPTDAKLQKGGDPRKLGEVVRRGVLTCLDPSGTVEIPDGTSGRLQLARWLTEGAAAPLAARVMANRVWQYHFGKPIVPTPSDFGLRGTPPTHPELLEWLAGAFVESNWSLKALHRRVMTSKTYRLASASEPSNDERDAGNVWLWRADRRRLDAEALRDTLLDLGGNLDRSRPGAHPFPSKDQWRWTAHHQFKAVYPSDHRSVYLMVQRLHPHPYLALFNGPDTSVSTPLRDSSAVPQQALFLMNSAFTHGQAGKFAASIIAAEPGDPAARLRLAYLRAFGRPPTGPESARALDYLERYRGSLAAEGVPPDRREADAWASLARAVIASNEFIYID